MDFLTINKNSVIYTAQNNEVVTLNLWNLSKDTTEAGYVHDFNIRTDNEIFLKDAVMGNASDNDNPDTVFEIEIKVGESIYAWCGKENIIKYEIVVK